MNKIIVIVNKSIDGYASGFAAWKKFKNDAQYFVSGYKQPLPEVELDKDTDVYIIDFTYPKEVMLGIYNRVNSLTLIENTKTVSEEVNTYPFSAICMTEHSCCVASWLFFHPSLGVPRSLRLVEDRSLWLFNYGEETENFHTGLLTMGITDDYIAWDLIYNDSYFLNDIISKGRVVNEYKKSVINEFILDPVRINYLDYYDYKVAVYNCINFISETANAILKKDTNIDVTISYQYYKDTIKFDLRTTSDKEIDVSKIAEVFGGGGSKNTAGFIISLSKAEPIDSFIDEVLSMLLETEKE